MEGTYSRTAHLIDAIWIREDEMVDPILRWACLEMWEAQNLALSPVATSLRGAHRFAQTVDYLAPHVWASAEYPNSVGRFVWRFLWQPMAKEYGWHLPELEERLHAPLGEFTDADFDRFLDSIDALTDAEWILVNKIVAGAHRSRSNLTSAEQRKWGKIAARLVGVVGERVKVEAIIQGHVYRIQQGTGAAAKVSSLTNNTQLPDLKVIEPSEHAIGQGFKILGDSSRTGAAQSITVTNNLTDRVLVLTSDAKVPVKIELAKGKTHTFTMAQLKHGWTFTVYEPKDAG